MCSQGNSYADIVKRPYIRDRQNQEGNRKGDQFKVSCVKVESNPLDLAWLWGSLTSELKSQYLAVNVQVELRKAGLDDYDARSIVYAGTGSSEDSSKASFPSLALLSKVLKSVGDDLAAGKLPNTTLPRESNTEVQNPLLAINDSADVVREEPFRNDGLESRKIEWHWKFRDDRDRMDGGAMSIIEGAEVDNSRLDMDSNDADSGDSKTLWATIEKALGFPTDAQLQLDTR
ncbi:hypothetical protein Ancab_033985 [Ancistrocladus abbreviatus]